VLDLIPGKLYQLVAVPPNLNEFSHTKLYSSMEQFRHGIANGAQLQYNTPFMVIRVFNDFQQEEGLGERYQLIEILTADTLAYTIDSPHSRTIESWTG